MRLLALEQELGFGGVHFWFATVSILGSPSRGLVCVRGKRGGWCVRVGGWGWCVGVVGHTDTRSPTKPLVETHTRTRTRKCTLHTSSTGRAAAPLLLRRRRQRHPPLGEEDGTHNGQEGAAGLVRAVARMQHVLGSRWETAT